MLEETALLQVAHDQERSDEKDQNVQVGRLREALDGQKIADHQQGDPAECEGEAEVAEQEGAVDEHREDSDAQDLAAVEDQGPAPAEQEQ